MKRFVLSLCIMLASMHATASGTSGDSQTDYAPGFTMDSGIHLLLDETYTARWETVVGIDMIRFQGVAGVTNGGKAEEQSNPVYVTQTWPVSGTGYYAQDMAQYDTQVWFAFYAYENPVTGNYAHYTMMYRQDGTPAYDPINQGDSNDIFTLITCSGRGGSFTYGISTE